MQYFDKINPELHLPNHVKTNIVFRYTRTIRQKISSESTQSGQNPTDILEYIYLKTSNSDFWKYSVIRNKFGARSYEIDKNIIWLETHQKHMFDKKTLIIIIFEGGGVIYFYVYLPIIRNFERGTCIKRLFWPPYEVKK